MIAVDLGTYTLLAMLAGCAVGVIATLIIKRYY